MGIFYEHSSDHPFSQGIQGAPGVGFTLTKDGDYDVLNKKLINVGTPSDNTDAATKKYVDDNSSGSLTTSRLTVDADIDMKDTYYIKNLKTPVDADDAATKQYADSHFLYRDGSHPMTGHLDMNNNRIFHIPLPTGGNQPTPLALTDLKYLHVAGTNKMTNNLNMDNKGIKNLRTPISDTDAANKKYVDDSIPNTSVYLRKDGTVSMTGDLNLGNNKITGIGQPTDNTDVATKVYVDHRININQPNLSDYLEKDGTVPMTGNLNLNSNKIVNLANPTSDTDAANKSYIDSVVHHAAVQPSHYADQFSYLMSSSNQWTDEIDGGTSFFISKIGNLDVIKGNIHYYNNKVLFVTINKNSQGGYKYKMGINFYRLTGNTDYTLCLELLNEDYQLWHKSQITVDNTSSTGLTIGNISVKKLSHRYTTSANREEFMYYHRIIVNFRKLNTGNKFFLHILVNIPQTGTDLAIYPRQFKKVYMIAYGIVGTVSNIDPDKTYDYHTAFDILSTEVVYNVNINTNQKAIKNIKLDQSSDNNVATIGLVKTLIPHIYNNLYREIFEEYYDFSDANIYGVRHLASGVIINSFNPNITIPNKDLSIIREDGINVNGFDLTFSPSNHTSKYTLCIVFTHWRNKSFSLAKKRSDNKTLTSLYYMNANNKLNLVVNNITRSFTMLNRFNGKRIVLFITENFDTGVTKFKMSNYSATLSIPSVHYSNDQYWKFTTDDGQLYRIMSSPKFYDFDSDQYHKVVIQEKLNGSYIE